MNSPSPSRPETWASAVLLLLAAALPAALLSDATTGHRRIILLSAATIGAVHLLLFAGWRWRQRREEKRLVEDVRLVLSTQVNTQLTLLQAAALLPEEEARIRAAQSASDTIASMIKGFSPESIRTWHAQHDEALQAARTHGLELGRK